MNIATADCETDPFKHNRIPKPFAWGYYDGSFNHFKSTIDFVNFIKSKQVVVYVHNGGKFDFHFLMPHLNHANCLIINNRMVAAKIGKAEIRDSYAILPFSLDSYQKVKIDYAKFESDVRDNHMHEIIDYLRSDCTNLYNIVLSFVNNYGSQYTLASSAVTTLKNKFLVKVENTNKNHYERFSKFYFGGRVECFAKGIIKGDIKCIDINSAYPYAMTKDHPQGSHFIISDSWNGDPTAFLEIECSSYGAFLQKSKCGLKPIYTNDVIPLSVTGWELKAGLELNLIDNLKINKVYTFFRRRNYKDYVNHFYHLKKTAKTKEDRLFSKLFLNTLYGKFAQNPENFNVYKIIKPKEANKYFSQGFMPYRPALFDASAPLVISKPSTKGKYYNIATGASITGCVRAILLKAIALTEEPLYCDTDSIFFKGKSNALIGDELGQWKVEDSFTSMAIGGKKLYSAKSVSGIYKTASKGARLSPQDIYKVAKGDSIPFKSDTPIFSVKNGIYFQDKVISNTTNVFIKSKNLLRSQL